MLDLTFCPCFKVKRWFTGFDELSFLWIQICIGSPMCRSSLTLLIIANLLILNDFMKAVSFIIHAEGYYRNSRDVYRGFTLAFDQSDSRTHPCRVRIYNASWV